MYEPKPRNWREFFGYRPSRALTWRAYRLRDCAEVEYRRWLHRERGLDGAEIEAVIARQHELMRRPLLQQHTYGPTLATVATKAAPDPLPRMLTLIKKLPWPAIERLQTAIDQRLAA